MYVASILKKNLSRFPKLQKFYSDNRNDIDTISGDLYFAAKVLFKVYILVKVIKWSDIGVPNMTLTTPFWVKSSYLFLLKTLPSWIKEP